jgi:hypothetical protein
VFCLRAAGVRQRGYINDVPKTMTKIGARPILWHYAMLPVVMPRHSTAISWCCELKEAIWNDSQCYSFVAVRKKAHEVDTSVAQESTISRMFRLVSAALANR